MRNPLPWLETMVPSIILNFGEGWGCWTDPSLPIKRLHVYQNYVIEIVQSLLIKIQCIF